ncbi:MAG: cupin domain-containing protein [Desulfobacteraceae bacterium]|nr:MAG: cupin domain-containing protein [Desulfobacteraceae bacterium]
MEGCHILEVSNDAEDEAVSIARARVETGEATEWHRVKNTVERYVIVSGKGRVEVEGLEPTEVRAGDVVRIPAGLFQRIANTGMGDLLFYCVCSPRFRYENYEKDLR